MKTIIYSCPFVPAEWIAAHDMRPRRIMPGPVGAAHLEGLCPYAQAFSDTVCCADDADAVVLTTVCDHMRRVSELIERDSDVPVFLMHVPSVWGRPSARELYTDELRRLGRFLVTVGGGEPSNDKLSEIMHEYDSNRSILRKARGRIPSREYSESIARFHSDGTINVNGWAAGDTSRHVPLALVGGPMISPHLRIFDLIERAGGTIVLDATTSGERTIPPSFDGPALDEDPILVLASAYFGGIPDAFRRPNDLLYEWLGREISARGIRGIIFRSYTWCDTWHAEAGRMKEWAEVPLLALTTGAGKNVEGPTLSRIESFVEMLK